MSQSPNSDKEMKFILKECDYWQKVLRLQDWNVYIRWAHPQEMEIDSALGEIMAYPQHKVAHIRLIKSEYYPPGAETLAINEPRKVLVHELLHIHFEDFWKEEKEEVIEQTINLITSALISLREK